MALLEKDVVVTTKHGRMPAFAACPDSAGTFQESSFIWTPGFSQRALQHGAADREARLLLPAA